VSNITSRLTYEAQGVNLAAFGGKEQRDKGKGTRDKGKGKAQMEKV
jgi:hypothetical protein